MALHDIAARLRDATTLYRAGKLREAERAYRAVLRSDPEQADALFMVGSLALESGRARQALPLLERAARRKPLQPEFHVGLGNALRRAGRAADAEASYRRALALRPEYAEVRLNLGHLLAEAGRAEDALAEYGAALASPPALATAARLFRARVLCGLRRFDEAHADADAVLAADPRNAEGLHVRAQSLLARGDSHGAELDLRRAVDSDPRHAGALNDLGVVLEQRGAMDEAQRYYFRAVSAQPQFADALRNLARMHLARAQWRESGRLWARLLRQQPHDAEALMNAGFCLQQIGRPKLAAQYYERQLRQAPDDMQALNNLASSLLAQGQPAAAEARYRAALERAPQNAETLHNVGLALYSQQRLEEAEPLLQDAWSRAPDNARIAVSLGKLRRAQGRAEEAVDWFARAVALDPALQVAEESLMWTMLTAGDFAGGWALQRKVRARDERWRARVAKFPQREWQGEPLAGKRVLVWAEQGLGDQVMFVNALRDLQARAQHVVLEASPRLVSLFSRSFPGVEVVPKASPLHPRLLASDIDFHCGMSALPWFLRPGWEAFPQHRGYLSPDPGQVAAWKAELSALGEGRRIGISWRGGTETTGGARRSTALAEWRSVLGKAGGRYVSVQYGKVEPEIAAVEADLGIRIARWPHVGSDMEAQAALIASLDLVISVCNTAVHMAGAVGTPVWTLVPARPGWRYLQRGARMPWYPSARLFRQETPGRWAGVFEEINAALGAG